MAYSLAVVIHRLGGLLLDLSHLPMDGLPSEVEDEVAKDLLLVADIVARVSRRLQGRG